MIRLFFKPVYLAFKKRKTFISESSSMSACLDRQRETEIRLREKYCISYHHQDTYPYMKNTILHGPTIQLITFSHYRVIKWILLPPLSQKTPFFDPLVGKKLCAT